MLSSVVVIDPKDPDAVYASAFKPPMAHRGAFVKIKDGQVIADLGSGLPRSVIEMEIDRNDPDVLYVTTHMYGVFKSADGGTPWQQLDDEGTGLPRTGIYDIDVDPANSSILYCTAIGGMLPDYMLPPGAQNLEGKCGVYKSVDGGDHWSLILETKSEARGIDIDPNYPDNLYVADMMGGVWVSNDGGKSWRQENFGLGSISMTSVKIRDNYIYASTQGSGVYSGVINANGSVTWDASRSNKPKAEVFKIQVECDPSNPDRIYASAYPGGLLRSDDGGWHWNDKNFLTPSIKVADPVIQGYYSFAINPSNPNIVWMGVYGKGVFVSYDAMDSDMFANGLDDKMAGKRITKVVINPVNPNEVYVASDEGVFVTRDNGRHWEEMNDGLQTLDIRTLRIVNIEWKPFEDGFDNGTADQWGLWNGWSVVRDGGNYVLQGIGHNWANAGSEMWGNYTFETKLRLNSGAVHVNFRKCPEGRYFLGFREGWLYLVKQYNQWSEFANLVEKQDKFSLGQWYELKVKVEEGKIEVYIDGALKMEYLDPNPILKGAIAFESLDESDVYVDDINVRIDQTSAIYAGTAGYGVYQFDVTARRWENLGRTLGTGWWSAWDRRMYQFSSILFDPSVPGRVYLGHFPGGFFISEDNGHTWKDSSLGLGNDGIFSLTMDPHDRNVIWAGTYNGVSKSADGGRTWILKSNGMPPQQWPFTVAIDEKDSNVMYASTKNGQNKGLAYRNSFYGVVMKSTDGGESWFKIMEGLSNRSEFYKVLIHPSYSNILFLSSSNGVYVSNDAGLTWQMINNGLATTYNQARDNVADNLALTSDGRYLLLGLSGYGLWKADVSKAIVLNMIPTASFSNFPTEPTVMDTVVFNDSSTDPDGSVISWHWEFGDGSSSDEQNPSHRFADKGNYTITLAISDNYGSKDALASILVVFNLPPAAGFDFLPSQPIEGDEVKFTDVSEDPEGHLVSWRWDFGDGDTSSTQNPTHKYGRAGDFTVSLTVADDEGKTDSISKNLSVKTVPAFIETPLGIAAFAGTVVAILLVVLIIYKKKR
jgi:PKD repeat protein